MDWNECKQRSNVIVSVYFNYLSHDENIWRLQYKECAGIIYFSRILYLFLPKMKKKDADKFNAQRNIDIVCLRRTDSKIEIGENINWQRQLT